MLIIFDEQATFLFVSKLHNKESAFAENWATDSFNLTISVLFICEGKVSLFCDISNKDI